MKEPEVVGIFSRAPSPEELDGELLRTLLVDNKDQRKGLAKDQAYIRSQLEPGENVIILRWSHRPQPAVSIVTDRRVIQRLRSGVRCEIEAHKVEATTVLRMPGGWYGVSIEGSAILVDFGEYSDANVAAAIVDRLYGLR